MTTYFAGGGFDCWVPAPAGVTDLATSINVAYNYCRAYLKDAAGAPVNATSLWFHADISANDYDPGNGSIPFSFNDAAGTQRARFRWKSDGGDYGYVFEYYDGTTWHGAPVASVPRAFGGTIDCQIVIDAVVGKIAWFYNGILAATLPNVNTSGMGSIAYFNAQRVEGYIGSGVYANTILASYNTVGHTVSRRTVLADGPEQAWAGDYSDINENTTNDTNALTTSTTGAISTFTGTTLAAPAAGSVIKSVVVGSRLRANGGAPTQVQAVLTIGGTDYFGPSIEPEGGFSGYTTAFDVDPSTSAPWATIGAVNGNFGVKAIA